MKTHYSTPKYFAIFGFCLLIGHADVQATVTSIGSNFNGTDVTNPDTIWFNANLTSVTGATGPVTLYFNSQTIGFTSATSGLTYNLIVPDSEIIIDPSISSPSTTYDNSNSKWITSVSSAGSNTFLGGLGWQVPAGENPKGTNPVTWAGNFSASQSGISINWQWAAAAYTSFSTNNNALGVTPQPANGLHDGVPVNYQSFVTGGARGGGGSNYTGSYSGTTSANNLPAAPEPSGALLIGVIGVLTLARRRKIT